MESNSNQDANSVSENNFITTHLFMPIYQSLRDYCSRIEELHSNIDATVYRIQRLLSEIEELIVQREHSKKEFSMELLQLKRRLVISNTQLKSIMSNMSLAHQ